MANRSTPVASLGGRDRVYHTTDPQLPVIPVVPPARGDGAASHGGLWKSTPRGDRRGKMREHAGGVCPRWFAAKRRPLADAAPAECGWGFNMGSQVPPWPGSRPKARVCAQGLPVRAANLLSRSSRNSCQKNAGRSRTVLQIASPRWSRNTAPAGVPQVHFVRTTRRLNDSPQLLNAWNTHVARETGDGNRYGSLAQ